MKPELNYIDYNRTAWNSYVENKDRWTIPVSDTLLEDARNGQWSVVLTPTKGVPAAWFPELKGLKILGLACGGGQQGPILAIRGADVTIFDNSDKQLEQDKIISDRHQLQIKTVQSDMRDLSVFSDNSFDLVFNPCSTLFIDDIQPVWNECFRVLKPGGILMTGLMHSLAFQIDETTLKLTYQQPYSDIHSLPPEKLQEYTDKNEPLIFGHSLTEQIGGQLKAGFILTDFYEDNWNGENVLDAYFPAFFATRAIKPKL